MTRRLQLREYRIEEGRLDEFVELWRSSVYPLRRRFGFTVEGVWMLPDEDRFIWLVGYDGPEGYEARDAEYYGSPERAALDPDPASLISEANVRFVTPVEVPPGG